MFFFIIKLSKNQLEYICFWGGMKYVQTYFTLLTQVQYLRRNAVSDLKTVKKPAICQFKSGKSLLTVGEYRFSDLMFPLVGKCWNNIYSCQYPKVQAEPSLRLILLFLCLKPFISRKLANGSFLFSIRNKYCKRGLLLELILCQLTNDNQ